jgi:hypothetical protein
MAGVGVINSLQVSERRVKNMRDGPLKMSHAAMIMTRAALCIALLLGGCATTQTTWTHIEGSASHDDLETAKTICRGKVEEAIGTARVIATPPYIRSIREGCMAEHGWKPEARAE